MNTSEPSGERREKTTPCSTTSVFQLSRSKLRSPPCTWCRYSVPASFLVSWCSTPANTNRPFFTLEEGGLDRNTSGGLFFRENLLWFYVILEIFPPTRKNFFAATSLALVASDASARPPSLEVTQKLFKSCQRWVSVLLLDLCPCAFTLWSRTLLHLLFRALKLCAFAFALSRFLFFALLLSRFLFLRSRVYICVNTVRRGRLGQDEPKRDRQSRIAERTARTESPGKEKLAIIRLPQSQMISIEFIYIFKTLFGAWRARWEVWKPVRTD